MILFVRGHKQKSAKDLAGLKGQQFWWGSVQLQLTLVFWKGSCMWALWAERVAQHQALKCCHPPEAHMHPPEHYFAGSPSAAVSWHTNWGRQNITFVWAALQILMFKAPKQRSPFQAETPKSCWTTAVLEEVRAWQSFHPFPRQLCSWSTQMFWD